MKILRSGTDIYRENVEVYLIKTGDFLKPYRLSFHLVDEEKSFEQRSFWVLKDAELAFEAVTGKTS